MDFTRAEKLTPEVAQEIRNAFEHRPWTEEQVAKGNLVRNALIQALDIIVQHVPPSPDRTAAIRKIREARMDCNSAITHGGKY